MLLMSIFSVANPQSAYPAEEVLAKATGLGIGESGVLFAISGNFAG